MSQAPRASWESTSLERRLIDTPLGTMLAMSNEIGLYYLRFAPHHSGREKDNEVRGQAYSLDIV